jgi:SAM-dependent methyltransferase
MSDSNPLMPNEAPLGVSAYYGSIAREYFRQYEGHDLTTCSKYPQNYYRLQWLLQRLATLRAQSVYEVGTGEGTPLALMAKMGLTVAGCDVTEEMVELTRKRLVDAGASPDRAAYGDIQDAITLAGQLREPVDAVIAFGVMPHVTRDAVALRNMRAFLKDGGRVFVEFRNKLFSLFTFNRHTRDFILHDLLVGLSPELKAEVARDLDARLDVNQPPQPSGDRPSYEATGARFHNPFEVLDLFEREGFVRPTLHWYHYHAAPPLVEGPMRRKFWEEASKLEHTQSWRGYFLCSAFVVEAERG